MDNELEQLKMPKNCATCWFLNKKDSICMLLQILIEDIENGRLENCPLEDSDNDEEPR